MNVVILKNDYAAKIQELTELRNQFNAEFEIEISAKKAQLFELVQKNSSIEVFQAEYFNLEKTFTEVNNELESLLRELETLKNIETKFINLSKTLASNKLANQRYNQEIEKITLGIKNKTL
jgi:hypothetical protein